MRTMLAACALAATLVAPAFADEPAKKGTDADDAFMTGIRKLGVMSGDPAKWINREWARVLSTSQRR